MSTGFGFGFVRCVLLGFVALCGDLDLSLGVAVGREGEVVLCVDPV